MAANVPDPMEREREHPRLTSAPKIEHGFLKHIFKVKTCPFDDCEDPAKCLFKHAGEQGRRDPSRFGYGWRPCLSYYGNGGSCPQGDTCRFAHGPLEVIFHPEHFMGIREVKFLLECYAMAAAVLPCERASVQLILDLKSTGQICEYEHDDVLLDPSYNVTGNQMAIARAARDAMSKHGHDDLPKTTVGSIDGPKFLRIIGGSCKLTPSDFAVPSTMVICKDLHKFAHGYYLTNTSTGSTDGPKFLTTSGSCKLVLPEFAGTSTVGSRLEGMMPLACTVDAWRMDAQMAPDHGMDMIEPVDLKLDSGASNHVVCEKTLLQRYQSLPHPWLIHVADGYPLEVVGVGFIITESFFIPKVYRVKGLKGNLISVSQLATDHDLFSVFDSGKCEVLKRDWDRVGGGFLQGNGIYKLRFLEVPEADGGYERA